MKKSEFMAFLDLPVRPKPHQEGITSFFDYFIPLRDVESLLEVGSEAIDYAKFIHIGLTPDLPDGWLEKKLALYKAKGIKTYPGGISFQVALVQNKVPQFYEWLVDQGFDAVEIADDAMKTTMGDEKRGTMIKMARDKGLGVFTELGKKHPDDPLNLEEAYESFQKDLALGVSHVTLERSELNVYMEGDPSPLVEMVKKVGLKHILFEPGPFGWPQVHRWLFQTFGPQVNLGNIGPEELMYVDFTRKGMSRLVDFDYFQ
jgi:phosphosulfolactate synthase